ncbi:MAG: phosphopentomutase [Lachnospiraceae bacterium]|nr:phosphopentomutase [Lachnospiraceae bacterium]
MENYKKYKRVFVIVIDSMGIGAMPDSKDFGDVGVDTLGHIAEKMYEKGEKEGVDIDKRFYIPNLKKLGLTNLKPIVGVDGEEIPDGYYLKMYETSRGKDTMTGHWEMMGINTTKPFITFTETGFPPELISELEKRTGREIIGNKSASGTEILEELGEQEINEGKLIVYTSADSVLQICGNEETMGVETLYKYCEIARELTMRDEWRVGRVIARPYTGQKKGEFVRTSNRHDYALKPTGLTALNSLKDAGYDVISVGKINDIFVGEGITESNRSKSSVHGMEQTIEIAKRDFTGLCFVNLVDFDALWGHRRDPIGYGQEIERFDEKLGQLLPLLGDEDLLMITADHGNDPTYTGTDHTRECVPLVMYSKSFVENGKLDDTKTFATIGATIADNFNVDMPKNTIGDSILQKLR